MHLSGIDSCRWPAEHHGCARLQFRSGGHAMMTKRPAFLVLLAACWVASLLPAQAQDAEKAFYAGKTVRMVVGSGVGGG